MLEKLILKQPENVRDKSYVTDKSVVIPKRLRQSEIRELLKPSLEDPKPNIGKMLYQTVELDKPKLKSIKVLLSGKGR